MKMKNLITIAILFMAFSASAQLKHVKVSGTHFDKGVDSKKWSNKTDDASTTAKFNDYTGESYVTFVADKAVRLKLDYTLDLSQGQVDIVFSGKDSPDNTGMLFLQVDGKGASKDAKTVHLEPGKEYRLVLRGDNAKGNFACGWTEL